MTTTKQINVQMTNWMQEVTDRIDGTVAYKVGTVTNLEKTLAVSLRQGGGTRFYCETHQRIYHMLAACPECAGYVLPGSGL